eukprot:GHVU01122509.1.p2 GENE.GHVU01122509.1~~GHVU01122509.1.p2  ORF type:complete len:100 (-),score=3.46 GHVU01122509.1:272-571(-)
MRYMYNAGPATMKLDHCIERCQGYGYNYAGVQGGSYDPSVTAYHACYCADAYGTAARYVERPTSECNMVCKDGRGGDTSPCGGVSRNSIFALKGVCDRP